MRSAEPTGPRNHALAVIVASSLALAAAYGSAFLPGGPPGWAPWAFVLGTALMLVGTMAMGAARRGSLGRLWWPLALVLILLVGGFGAVLLMPPADPRGPELWLGLPPRAAIVIYGIGLAPLLLVPVAYAWTFQDLTLGPGDVDRVREAALRARRPGSEPGMESGEGRRDP